MVGDPDRLARLRCELRDLALGHGVERMHGDHVARLGTDLDDGIGAVSEARALVDLDDLADQDVAWLELLCLGEVRKLVAKIAYLQGFSARTRTATPNRSRL
jgi:hypothetical protein